MEYTNNYAVIYVILLLIVSKDIFILILFRISVIILWWDVSRR